MRQGGPRQREHPKQCNHRQGDAQDEALCGFFKVESLLENRNDGDDGQDEVDGVVIEELASQFGPEGAEIQSPATHALAMETEAGKVVFDVPDSLEASGYSTATKARLDGHKLATLGWKPHYDILTGIERTMKILSKND